MVKGKDLILEPSKELVLPLPIIERNRHHVMEVHRHCTQASQF